MAETLKKSENPATEIEEAADRLWRAEETGDPCEPVRDLIAAGGPEAAYRVQQINIDRKRKSGLRPIGRKIGLTSFAVQRQLGVDEPDYGALMSDMILGDGCALAPGRILQPKAEAEIAFLLGSDIDVRSPNVADVLRATACVMPAIEIVGSRVANWDIRLVDTIADNASSGMFVLGTPARAPLGIDFTGCAMEMRHDDTVVSTGSGAACMGNPLNAVAWLAGRMQAMGQPLRAGEIILSGALGPMFPLEKAGRIVAEISGIGTASFTMAEN